MKNRKKITLGLLLAVAFLLTQNQSASAGGWGNVATIITGYYVWGNGDAHFRVANMENPDGCSSPRYLTIDSSSTHFEELYATLMAAYASGKTVRLSYSGCTQSGSYPLVNAIAVPDVW